MQNGSAMWINIVPGETFIATEPFEIQWAIPKMQYSTQLAMKLERTTSNNIQNDRRSLNEQQIRQMMYTQNYLCNSTTFPPLPPNAMGVKLGGTGAVWSCIHHCG